MLWSWKWQIRPAGDETIKGEDKTKEQLVNELGLLRQWITELGAAERLRGFKRIIKKT